MRSGEKWIGRSKRVAWLVALGIVLAGAVPASGSVLFDGLVHDPLGAATLSAGGDSLRVAGIGSSGTDGVKIGLPPRVRTFDATFGFPVPLQTGGEFDIQYYSGSTPGTITRAEKFSGDTTRVSVNFREATDTSTVRVDLYRRGTLVQSGVIVPPPPPSLKGRQTEFWWIVIGVLFYVGDHLDYHTTTTEVYDSNNNLVSRTETSEWSWGSIAPAKGHVAGQTGDVLFDRARIQLVHASPQASTMPTALWMTGKNIVGGNFSVRGESYDLQPQAAMPVERPWAVALGVVFLAVVAVVGRRVHRRAYA